MALFKCTDCGEMHQIKNLFKWSGCEHKYGRLCVIFCVKQQKYNGYEVPHCIADGCKLPLLDDDAKLVLPLDVFRDYYGNNSNIDQDLLKQITTDDMRYASSKNEQQLLIFGFMRNYVHILTDNSIIYLIESYLYQYLNKTALFYHIDCLKHMSENMEHVECPKRCLISYQMLNKYELLKHLIHIIPREATKTELKLTHSSIHVDKISDNQTKCGWFDDDTFYNQYSSRASKLAAGAVIDLMSGILNGSFNNGFALVRPPGHHCEHNQAMGFCLFNNVVVAVNCVRANNLCKKVLIVDWDVHHGNGTQNMFYDDKNVLYFSVHRFDGGSFYPGTGKVEESGDGFNINLPLNIPMDQGFGDKDYLLIWKDVLLPICKEFEPDIIIISAGFDACIGDPLGGMRISPPCYGLLTRLLLNQCEKVAIVLEGGYNLMTMPRAICCCMYALLKGTVIQKNNFDVDEFYNEFKANVLNSGNNEHFELFHEWYRKYWRELMDASYSCMGITGDVSTYKACQCAIKNVLMEHQKYWKCARIILEKCYGDIKMKIDETISITRWNE